ncbi:hypothetical protein A8709_15365 [Paenibacillus pectinilyticus]|uniref:Uncharacterized protein n=1 Tax=Paenibacillus pectinilyticus TaxID=512399 RepID=A0A1C1A4H6_9BACL|nr:spore germination protein [Paenibacillus pectinilyticus]OCT15455.1 hypothetical protein A8709_15365 [Paenibacillus pectinilyticus]
MNKKTVDVSHQIKQMAQSSDFLFFENKSGINPYYSICYYKPLIDPMTLHEKILFFLNVEGSLSLEDLFAVLPLTEKQVTSDWTEIEDGLLRGYVAIQFEEHTNQTLIVCAAEKVGRSVQPPEIEFSVVGPKEAFVESLEVNLNLLRKRLPIPNLRTKEMIVGNLTKSKTVICYLEGFTNEAYVNTAIERIEAIDFDFVLDTTMLSEMIEDDFKSIFPQSLETERPDRIASALTLGQFAIIMDGSPHALMGPVSLGWFFVAYEDYYLPWHVASFFRLLRFCAVCFSIIASAVYVAITTYHYEAISNPLLSTLISSRANIPFPPFIEALVMELTIELLREAGARLPSKIGQTIGIVGGIVIGTAAVQASLTSNVLLMIIGLSALASFTTPTFRMSTTIRVLRYPFIFAAEWLGFLGIFIVAAFLLIHLLRLKTMGMPYLVPFFPFRGADLRDSLVRFPYSNYPKTPSYLRTQRTARKNTVVDEE